MSINTNEPLKNCDNHYTIDDLYEIFGMDDKEIAICLNCSNHRMEGGIITCKYILEGINGGN